MPRTINYGEPLAFRAPKWCRQDLDDMRGPGEHRSDVLRTIVIGHLLERRLADGGNGEPEEE